MTRTIRSPGQVALIEILIDARKSAGLTQAQFAEKLRCHQSFVARVESGQRRVDVAELVILCRALGVDPGEVSRQVAQAVPPDARI
ncbi:MAG TPA: helix-turn-helix transcriptional regulator [Paenirhodobacter sp.]